MKKRSKKLMAVLLAGCMAVSMAACGSGGSGKKAGKDTSYTMWIYSGVESTYYTDYAENPVLAYAMDKEWGSEGKAVDLEFWVPPAGTAIDSYNTMIQSGDLPDVLDASIANSPVSMYNDGYVMDLTELIQENMPNYMAYLEAHPELKDKAYEEIDGQQRMIYVEVFNESLPYYFSGMEYRRDWLAKYGTNPETGAAFTGGFSDENDPDSWSDDIVFPSGGTDPVYISDWEWMFDIFTKAMEDQGITDGYCTSMYYPGFTWSGGLLSCFGGGTCLWYAPEDTNQVEFGGDREPFRAYLTCLNNWYEKGWLDQKFNERTSDAHYAIDDTTVRQGKVGMWLGVEGQLGNRLDMNDGGLTEGICVYGCAWPINDVYGSEECKNVIPDCVTNTSLEGTSYYITTAAEGKDIATLLSFMDYFYSEEGAVLRSAGLNAEQVAEIDNKFYKDYGLENGAYTVEDDGRYRLQDTILHDGGNLIDAVMLTKFPGISLVSSIDKGYAENYEKSLASWIQYKNTAFYQGTDVTNNMDTDMTNEIQNIQNKLLEYMTVNAPDFIKGVKDIEDDKEWDNWCKVLQKYNYQKVIDLTQPFVDKYEFR